jgi:hypothetical protein
MSTQSINALGCHGMRPPIPHLSWTHFILMMMVALPNKEHMRVSYMVAQPKDPVTEQAIPQFAESTPIQINQRRCAQHPWKHDDHTVLPEHGGTTITGPCPLNQSLPRDWPPRHDLQPQCPSDQSLPRDWPPRHDLSAPKT